MMRALNSEFTTPESYDGPNFYMHRPVLQIIDGYNLGRAYKLAGKFGPKFWGIERGPTIAPIPDDIPNRIIQFKKVLQVVPDIDSSTFNWAHGPAKNIIDEGEKNLNQKIVLQRQNKRGKKQIPHVSTTYGEALQDPEIMYSAFGKLLENRDPVAEAIEALENWRINQTEESAPTTRFLHLGIEAYKICLLGIRRSEAQSAIAGIAIANFAKNPHLT